MLNDLSSWLGGEEAGARETAACSRGVFPPLGQERFYSELEYLPYLLTPGSSVWRGLDLSPCCRVRLMVSVRHCKRMFLGLTCVRQYRRGRGGVR